MKNLTSRMLLFIILLAGCSFFGSCTDETIIEHYIYVDSNSFTFDKNGNNTLTLQIESNPEWSVENNTDWIEIIEQTTTSVTFSAALNDSGENRSAVIKIVAGEAYEEIEFNQLANNEKTEGTRFIRFGEFSTYSPVVISPNGRYAAGYTHVNFPDYTYEYTPNVIDLQTGSVVRMTPTNKAITIKSVSDDGDCVIVTDQFSFYATLQDNEYTELEKPTSYSFSYFGLNDASADGNMVCGFGNMWTTSSYDVPLVWENGTPKELKAPDTNYYGGEDIQGFRVMGCSDDGTVFYGTERFSNTGIFWGKDGDPLYIGKEYYEYEEGYVDMSDWGIYDRVWTEIHSSCKMSHTDVYRMSPNGRYITTYYAYGHIKEDSKTEYYNYPICFDSTTGETDVFFDLENMIGTTVSNEGILFLQYDNPSSSYDDIQGMVFDPVTNELISASEWVKNKFGIVIPESFVVTRASANGTLLGYITVNGEFGTQKVYCAVIPEEVL